jgi:RHS repeat-associated protein
MIKRNDEFWVHDGYQIVLTLNNKGSVKTRNLWGANVDELIATNNQFTLCDHLGSIRDVIDAKGKVIGHREYNAFGKVTRSTGKVEYLFGYTGKMFDNKTQLQWNINRWYDANAGRWISEDPIGFRGNDVNICRYVSNQLLKRKDHNGLRWLAFCIDFLEDVIASIVGTAAYEFCTNCVNSPDCDENPPQPTPIISEDKTKYCLYHGVPYEEGEAYLRPSVSSTCKRKCAWDTTWLPCCDSSGTFISEAWYVCKNTNWLWGTNLNWRFDRWGSFVLGGQCSACACGSGCKETGIIYNNPPT